MCILLQIEMIWIHSFQGEPEERTSPRDLLSSLEVNCNFQIEEEENVTHVGTIGFTNFDEFSENFQREGGGVTPIRKIPLQIFVSPEKAQHSSFPKSSQVLKCLLWESLHNWPTAYRYPRPGFPTCRRTTSWSPLKTVST